MLMSGRQCNELGVILEVGAEFRDKVQSGIGNAQIPMDKALDYSSYQKNIVIQPSRES